MVTCQEISCRKGDLSVDILAFPSEFASEIAMISGIHGLCQPKSKTNLLIEKEREIHL
jgi:hypothetical protein